MKKELTVSEMGRKGGLETKRRHPDHFRRIGIKGRATTPKEKKEDVAPKEKPSQNYD